MLYQLFQTTLSESDFNELLQLTFTENERAMMVERWRIFEAFDRGCSQREVAKEVPCSIVTATRGAKVYRDHKEGVKKHLERWRKWVLAIEWTIFSTGLIKALWQTII